MKDTKQRLTQPEYWGLHPKCVTDFQLKGQLTNKMAGTYGHTEQLLNRIHYMN